MRKTETLCELVYPSKIKHQQTQLKGKCMISVTRLALHYNPIFISRKLEQDLKPREIKPPVVNQQCSVYYFTCDLCDSDYTGFTARHVHQRIVEHKNSAIGKHFLIAHGDTGFLKESQFRILKKCQGNLIALSRRCFSSRSAILVTD